MKTNLLRWQFSGFIFTGIVGVLLHFLYEWSNENKLAAIFSGVNESTWEHMKLLFFPMLIFSLIEGFLIKENYINYWGTKLKGILLGMLMIPTIFYTLNGMFGKTPDWLNITIFFISAAIAYSYETKKLNHPNALYIPPAAVLLILSVITALFIKFTFSPPHIPLFKDPLTYSYGLMQY
ncbi:MAG: hypothetical protein E7652_05495 [Ruminococcaceae bacterium]|nr:hypothetical protein [Oscillospiraceae bacterium]